MSKIQMKRYNISDVYSNNFYQLPKFILEGKFKNLSNDARVLYSLLKERHKLSLENKWVNNKGEVYLIFTRKNMQDMLGKSDKTVKKIVEELKTIGLMEEERMGLTKANRIYLTIVDLGTPLKRSYSDSVQGIAPSHDKEIVRKNKKNFNKTNSNNNSNFVPNKFIEQYHNFDQREYSEDDYEQFYSNYKITRSDE